MSKIELVKSIKEMTLYELDDFTWKKYEHSNKSVEVILKRPDSDYEIHQMHNDGASLRSLATLFEVSTKTIRKALDK